MPIYAYRCTSCGHAQDVLQKLSDDVLTVCPACGKDSYAKQVTAAGFQLKGSGWYVTDFRDGNKGGAAKPDDKAAEKPDEQAPGKPGEKPADGKPAEAKAGESAAAGTPSTTPAAPKPAAAAAPAAAPSTPPASGG